MEQNGSDLAGAKILIVDDNPTNIKVLLGVLEAAGYSILAATSGEKALNIASRAEPELILLDVMMPGLDGYEVCRRLKQDDVTRSIPVIFVTANDQDEGLVAGFEAGGVD
ncbi:MAG: response regulator, partial [Gemmatimonadetes bacterium]|nr:response regulator [Gemmatimonadota bacterium]